MSRIKQLVLVTFVIYFIASSYTVYLFLAAPEAKKDHKLNNANSLKRKQHNKRDSDVLRRSSLNKTHTIEVWSKVGLGSYTWEYILGGHLEPRLGGIWSYGELLVENFFFRMRDGEGVLPDRVPQDAENIILILNGRAQNRVQSTQAWLDYLDTYPRLSRMVLMLIGNEQCENDWILPYMKSRGGKVDMLFIVYDAMIINGVDIFQWPLGAATYRGFPMIHSSQLNLVSPRRYRCNFLGTVYDGSSREELIKILADHRLESYCYVKTRLRWEPDETDASLQSYVSILQQSDLTLSPVGINVECYRIYEACALGSVPVVEDVTTSGDCSRNPLRLLKELDAPFIFISDWRELPKIIEHELTMSVQDIIVRRQQLVVWFENFKHKMKALLMGKLQGLFEGDQFR